MANSSLKSTLARKAAKTGAKHTAHGATSKLKRKPLRAVTLLSVGAVFGAIAGWLAARGAPAAPSPG
jgi:hypothetical protein